MNDDELRVLVGERPGLLPAAELADRYPWPEGRRWIRAMMVASLDGAAAGPDGRSGSISSATDRAVLSAVRSRCDVVLIGASTLRVERYSPMRVAPEQSHDRTARGLLPHPRVAVVSRSLRLDWRDPFFTQAPQRPIVLTTADADPTLLAEARSYAEVVVVPVDEISPEVAHAPVGAMVSCLEALGLRRIVCEGGPTLLASLLASNLVDELDLAFSPVVAGVGARSAGPAPPLPEAFTLEHLMIDTHSFMFCRYVRSTAGVKGLS